MSLAAIPVARVRSIPFPSQLVSSDFFISISNVEGRACSRRAAGGRSGSNPGTVIREGRGGMGASHTTGGCRVREPVRQHTGKKGLSLFSSSINDRIIYGFSLMAYNLQGRGLSADLGMCCPCLISAWRSSCLARLLLHSGWAPAAQKGEL